jgi:hypothetical protein
LAVFAREKLYISEKQKTGSELGNLLKPLRHQIFAGAVTNIAVMKSDPVNRRGLKYRGGNSKWLAFREMAKYSPRTSLEIAIISVPNTNQKDLGVNFASEETVAK